MEVAQKSLKTSVKKYMYWKNGFEFLNKLWHAGYKDGEKVAEEETST